MKVFYALAAFFVVSLTAHATTWNVTVANLTFSPATVNAVVGDVIQFNWASGTHTTTCDDALVGTSRPSGAAAWDANMTSASTTFSYTVTVPGTYLYGCTPHFDLGMKGTINVSGPLPVKLGTFTVSNDKNRALLNWQTFSELNVDHFSIRRSTDGTHFTEVGKIKATGNSDRTVAYNFSDNNPGGVYKYLYYEIAIVDIDKKESFSPIRTYRNGAIVKDNLIVSLSPNPIARPGQVQLKFNADKEGEMDVLVYNNAGQRVLTTKLAAFYGLNSGHLHVCDLPKGTYNIVFVLAGKKEIKKVVVQ